jgi:hypothetical protein
LSGAGADVEKEHAVDAAECCSDTVSIVEIPDGDVDAIGEEFGARRVADERAEVVAFLVQLFYEGPANVAGSSGDEVHS